MDTPAPSEAAMKAGSDYVAALQRLGMDIDFAAWGYDEIVRHHVLLLSSSFMDTKGPLEISRVLFRAFEGGVVPTEVDPFWVRLHSPEQRYVRSVKQGTSVLALQTNLDGTTQAFAEGYTYHEGHVAINNHWVIVSKPVERRKPVEIGRRWNRFVRNVAMAA